MLQHLLSQTHPPVLQAQIGHGTPLTHLIAPGGSSPQCLVSIDEAWELKLWQIATDTAPVEYLSVTLTDEIGQAQWCEHTPHRLWCQDLEGNMGYYDFDLVGHQATFHAFVSLPPLSNGHAHRGLGFCQSHKHLLMLSHQGLWKTPINAATNTSANSLEKLSSPPEKDLDNALQMQITNTPEGIYFALLTSQHAQVFQLEASEHTAAAICQSVFCCDLETPASTDTAFLLAQQGQYLAVDRHVYAIHNSDATRHTYYGRPLAFFDFSPSSDTTKPCLLWASGDTLFTTALSEQGEILQHQEMQYTGRYRSWPIFWSFAVADTRSETPTFWVADHHRHNASVIIAPTSNESLTLGYSLVGEGGWVESLCFTQKDRLYLGGGQKGTLCQLQLSPLHQNPLHQNTEQQVTLSQHYQAPPQAVETLWKLSNPDSHQDSEFLLTLSAGVLRCYDTQQAEAIEITAPPAPWHKALENGALEQLAVLPKGWIAQFAYKGKVSIQHYNITTQRWQILSQKLPEQAVLLAAISDQELLMEHDNPTGLFKIYFPHSQKWQDLPCDFEAFDQILWNNAQQLLAIVLEGELQVWHHRATGQWHCCHHISQDAFFNGMAFSESAAELWTLDNDGCFKHWSINTQSAQDQSTAAHLLQQTKLSQWGPEAEDRVVSISAEGTLIALGDRDQPLRVWDGTTGDLCYSVLVCVNAEGTDTDIAVVGKREHL